jgi:hypothetical protein
MPWPQDPPEVQESFLIEHDFGGGETLALPALGIVLAVVIALSLLRQHDQPSWRSKRITEAARKGAARSRQARQQ